MPAKARPVSATSTEPPLRVIRPAPLPPSADVAARNAPPPEANVADVKTPVRATAQSVSHSQLSSRHRTAHSFDLTDHQRKRIREENDAKDLKKTQQLIIHQSNATRRFFYLCQHHINIHLSAFRTLASRKIALSDNVTTGVQLVGDVLSFWTAGISKIFAALGNAAYSKITVGKMEHAILLIGNTTTTDSIIEETITQLTLSYANSLKLLTENGIEIAAKFAAKQILEKLLIDNEDFNLGMNRELLKIKLFNAVSHHPSKDKCSILDAIKSKEIATVESEKWTDQGLFWRSPVITAQGVIFQGKNRKDKKQGCCNKTKYQPRLARDEDEIAELRKLDDSLPYGVAPATNAITRPRSSTAHMYTRSVFVLGDVAILRAEAKAEMLRSATPAAVTRKLSAAAPAHPPVIAPVPSAPPLPQNHHHKRASSVGLTRRVAALNASALPIPSAPPLPKVANGTAPVFDESRAASAALSPTFSAAFSRFQSTSTTTAASRVTAAATLKTESKAAAQPSSVQNRIAMLTNGSAATATSTPPHRPVIMGRTNGATTVGKPAARRLVLA